MYWNVSLQFVACAEGEFNPAFVMIVSVQQVFKHQVTPPPQPQQPMMRVRRDNCAHLLTPRHRRHSNDCLQANDMPISTTNFDDIIDALQHDISHNTVTVRPRASSIDTDAAGTDSRSSPFSSQLFS